MNLAMKYIGIPLGVTVFALASACDSKNGLKKLSPDNAKPIIERAIHKFEDRADKYAKAAEDSQYNYEGSRLED